MFGCTNGVSKFSPLCCAGTSVGVAAWQTAPGSWFSWSVTQKTSVYTWVTFLTGLSCVTTDSCAGLEWDRMWRKEKAAFLNAFNGSSQFSFIWAAALFGLIELLSSLFEMHRVTLWCFCILWQCPPVLCWFNCGLYGEIDPAENNVGEIAFQLNQLSDTGYSVAIQAALLPQCKDTVAGQEWILRQGKVCLRGVTFVGQLLNDMLTGIKKEDTFHWWCLLHELGDLQVQVQL